MRKHLSRAALRREMELLGRETEPAGVDRTVDDARIQAKLGVRSRVELAGRLAR